MSRVVAIGSRYWRDWDAVRQDLKDLPKHTEVVTGTRGGADAIVRGVCNELCLPCTVSHEPTKDVTLGVSALYVWHTDRDYGTNSRKAMAMANKLQIPVKKRNTTDENND